MMLLLKEVGLAVLPEIKKAITMCPVPLLKKAIVTYRDIALTTL
jgi:hypothetical protein